MKTSGLRLGNLLKMPGMDNPYVVTNLSYSIPEIEYEGIEIDKNWLLHLGFKEKKNDVFEYVGKHPYWDEDMVFMKIKLTKRYCKALYINVYISYVHELQNLFFAFTETELITGYEELQD